MYKKIDVTTEEIKPFLEVFKNEDNQKNMFFHFNESYVSTKVYIDSEEESNLYFYLFKDEIVIQNISVTNKRRGVGTKLIKLCCELGMNKGVKKIRIQSVISQDMIELCNKLGLKQDNNYTLMDQYGDYTGFIKVILNT